MNGVLTTNYGRSRHHGNLSTTKLDHGRISSEKITGEDEKQQKIYLHNRLIKHLFFYLLKKAVCHVKPKYLLLNNLTFKKNSL
jgi:hypothetical protein